MTKLRNTLGLAIALAAATTLLAGCELYFGDGGEDDNWNYCGSDGYYSCTGDDCTWIASSCPSGGGNGSGGGGGFSCTDSTDCAAGCYCQDGICEEAGFCSSDKECGPGYHCNVDRASCEPDETPTGCTNDGECASGTTCDVATGGCTTTCSCTTDAGAVQGGYDYCDEVRSTCMSGTDPNGTCTGDVTCPTAAPTCAEGTVPAISNGCYTGACTAIAGCSEAPSCDDLKHEGDCLNRATDCSAVYTGLNCRKPDGSACMAGDSGCVCSDFRFYACDTRANAKSSKATTDSTGKYIDLASLFH